jgi:hypothetical protein
MGSCKEFAEELQRGPLSDGYRRLSPGYENRLLNDAGEHGEASKWSMARNEHGHVSMGTHEISDSRGEVEKVSGTVYGLEVEKVSGTVYGLQNRRWPAANCSHPPTDTEKTMGRPKGADAAGHCYHVLNRANLRATIFHKPEDVEYVGRSVLRSAGLDRSSDAKRPARK